MDTTPISLIKINNDEKSYKVFVKIKFRRDPTSAKLNRYKFKMALFYNGKMEEFLLFIGVFQMTFKVSGALIYGAKIHYLRTLVHAEAFRHIDMLSDEVGSTNSENLNSVILSLGASCFLLLQCQDKSAQCTSE